MEMYLAQMIVFKIIKKLHLLYVFGNSGVGGWCSFIYLFILIVFGFICFIECYKIAVRWFKKWKGVLRDKT